MKKKSGILILAILMGIFILASCQKEETIKIGFSGTLSGANSGLGISGRNGALLAVSKINEAGGIKGKKLEMIVKDDKNDKEIALQIDREFSILGVAAIVGHMTSDMAELTVPYINENKILMVSPTISADALTNINDYFFSMIPSNVEQATSISKAMSMEKVSKAAIIFDSTNATFTEGLKDRFKEYFIKASGAIVYEKSYNPESVNYGEITNDIFNSGAEGVFIIGAGGSASMFAQTFYKQGIKVKLFLPSWAMTSELLNQGGKAIDAASIVNFYDNQSNASEYMAFEKEYVRSYGIDPCFSAQFSYEAIMVLADVIDHSEETSAASLKKYIITEKTFSGLQETISFDEFGDMSRQSYIYKVQDGKFEVISNGGVQ